MKLRLKREVNIEAIEVQMDIRRSSPEHKRRDILAVLQLAEDLESQGLHITPEQINAKLLLRDEKSPFGQRLLRLVESYGLLYQSNEERGYSDFDSNAPTHELTDLGWRSLETNLVKIPESGTYTILFTDDPLLHDYYFLGLMPTDERRNLSREMSEQTKRPRSNDQQSNGPATTAVPAILRELEGRNNIRLLAHDFEEVDIISVQPRGIRASPYLTMDIDVTLDSESPKSVDIRVKYGKSEQAIEDKYGFSFSDVFDVVARASGLETDLTTMTIRKVFETMTPLEVTSGRSNIPSCPSIRLGDMGVFESVPIQNVRVRPAYSEDAIKWANHRLISSIDYYCDVGELEKKKEFVASEFSEWYSPQVLLDHMYSTYELIDLIKRSRASNQDKFWFLFTPLTLDGRVI